MRIVKVLSVALLCMNLYALDTNTMAHKILKNQDATTWMQRRIDNEIYSYQSSSFDPRKLDALIKGPLSDPCWLCSLIQVKNNTPTIFLPRRRGMTIREQTVFDAVKILCQKVNVPDVTVIFSTHDAFNEKYPVLTFAKNKGSKTLLIPDFEALVGYKDMNVIEAAGLKCPWERKLSKIFWRGSLTGGLFDSKNYASFPRSRAVFYSYRYPEILDARFIENGQASKETMKLMRKQGYFSSPVSPSDSLQYKYLLDIDGNTCCYSRTYWSLLSNSLVLKHESDAEQWYYDLLKEGIHYVKINRDFSNLREMYTWLREHDQEAKQIACNATCMVKENLTQEDNYVYFYLLLCKIAELQKN